MTLVLAICIGKEKRESILFSSDSQATNGSVTYAAQKIFPILSQNDEPLAIAAGAGDIAMIKKAVDMSLEILDKNADEKWDNKTPYFDQFRQAIPAIETALVEKISKYRDMKIEFDFDFLLGSVGPHGTASLYFFDSEGITRPVHDDPRFACIGSGFYVGGNLLLQQFYSPNIDVDEADHLAAYVINQVSKVDPGVGSFEGESWHFRLEDGKPIVGYLTRSGLRETRSEYDSKQKLLKYVWEQSGVFGSKELLKMIRQAIREKGKRAQS